MAQNGFTTVRGTGESYVNTRLKVRQALNNVIISREEADLFLYAISMKYTALKGVTYTLAERNGVKHNWGMAYLREKRLNLNRHTWQVFLHELAHIHSFHTYHERGHGYKFGVAYDEISNYFFYNPEWVIFRDKLKANGIDIIGRYESAYYQIQEGYVQKLAAYGVTYNAESHKYRFANEYSYSELRVIIELIDKIRR